MGLVFGSLVAFVNSRLTKHYLKKQATEKNDSILPTMAMSFGRMLISAAALVLVFVLRNWLPWPFAAVILGTAIGLTAVSFALIYRLTKKYQDL